MGIFLLPFSTDRVLRFCANRPNRDSPTPSHAGECVHPLPPLVPGGHTRLQKRGWGWGWGWGGGSQFWRGDRHCGVIGIQCIYFAFSILWNITFLSLATTTLAMLTFSYSSTVGNASTMVETTEYTGWQWPLSGGYSIMMVKSWVWGMPAHPLSLYPPSRTKL